MFVRVHKFAVTALSLGVLSGCVPATSLSTSDSTTAHATTASATATSASTTAVTYPATSTAPTPFPVTSPPTRAPNPPAPAPSAPPTIAPTTTASPPSVVSDVSGGGANFFSPTGNVVCQLSSNAGGTSPIARCEILQHSWTAPPSPASCRLDWGSYFYIDSTARFACVGDTIRATQPFDPGNPPAWYRPGIDSIITVNQTPNVALGYGRTLIAGALACASSVLGVTCTNRSTGAMLFLSRDRYIVR